MRGEGCECTRVCMRNRLQRELRTALTSVPAHYRDASAPGSTACSSPAGPSGSYRAIHNQTHTHYIVCTPASS